MSRMDDLKKIDQTALELSTEVSSRDKNYIEKDLVELHEYVVDIIKRMIKFNEKIKVVKTEFDIPKEMKKYEFTWYHGVTNGCVSLEWDSYISCNDFINRVTKTSSPLAISPGESSLGSFNLSSSESRPISLTQLRSDSPHFVPVNVENTPTDFVLPKSFQYNENITKLNKWASGCEARLLKNKFENLKHVTVDQIETLFNELANIENEMKCKKCTMISSKSEILHNLQNNITKKLVQVIEFEKIKLKQMVIESEELRTTAESFDKFVDDQLTVVRKLNVTLILNKTSSISDVKKVINKMNGIRNELLKKIVKVKSINKILKTIKEGKMIVPEDNVITLMSKRMDNSSKRLTSLLKSMNHELLNIENKTKKEKQLPAS